MATWPLKFLTIGPLVQKSEQWCESALDPTPSLPYLENITILCRYRKLFRYGRRFWRRMDQLFARQDLFPRLKRLDICATVGSKRLQHAEHQRVFQYLPTLHRAGKVYFWGDRRECSLDCRVLRIDDTPSFRSVDIVIVSSECAFRCPCPGLPRQHSSLQLSRTSPSKEDQMMAWEI